jgi:hypothetical protein
MNSQRQLIEQTREFVSPLLATEGVSPVLHWLAAWFMQTPVENIQGGSFVLFEFKQGASAVGDSPTPVSSAEGVCWGAFPLVLDRIDTVPNVSVTLSAYPINLDSVGSQSSKSSSVSCLNFDVVLSRKTHAVDVKSVLSVVNK